MIKTDNTATRARIIQEDVYAEAGTPGFAFSIPAPFNADHFTSLAELGVDPNGFANQANQVLAENLANNMSSRIKKAAKDGQPLPTQDDMDALYASYDFSGSRSGARSFGSLFDKLMWSAASSFVKQLIKEKGFRDMSAPVTVAKKTADEPGPGEIDYDTFEGEVSKLVNGEGPWGEKKAFIGLRDDLIAEAKAEEDRRKQAEAAVSSKLAKIDLG